MMKKKPELLVPAGDMEKLKMAVLYGADAVYLAGSSFGMRAFAGNFTPEELPKAVRFAHDHGVLDEHCDCPACRGGFTRAYIHHLVRQKEMLGGILLSQHNIRYLLALMERVRAAIAEGRYAEFYRDWMNSPAANDF